MNVKSYTKSDVIRRTAELVGKRFCVAQTIVDGVFKTLSQMLLKRSIFHRGERHILNLGK